MAVNLRAPFLCMQAAAPRMREGARDRGGRPGPAGVPGAVVNLADLSALHAWKEFAHHGASKAGLLQLTRTAAKELGPHVRVNAVIPGPILPPPGEDPASEAWHRRGARLPLGRTGEPAEVGDAVVFLAASDFITGAAISVDGGERLLTGRPDP
ncbi:MAG: SDR family oxidoreductase, partial [Gemmatimonadota bacterium]